MKQNEQIEGEAFYFFQSSPEQRRAELSGLGGLWGEADGESLARGGSRGESDMEGEKKV